MSQLTSPETIIQHTQGPRSGTQGRPTRPKESKEVYATVTHAPPASLIFSSARREKNLALTITGWSSLSPFPRTLKYPALTQSITATLPPSRLAVRVYNRQSGEKVYRGQSAEGHATHLLGHKRPQLVDVDRRAEVLLGGLVKVAHTNLTEVTRVTVWGKRHHMSNHNLTHPRNSATFRLTTEEEIQNKNRNGNRCI